MIFTYSKWDKFCEALAKQNIQSITAKELLSNALLGNAGNTRWINLKHDVESNPDKALKLAQIEASYGHHATYYVQSYLMTEQNRSLFLSIQKLGHEVTYHHDVIDGGKGDMNVAYNLFVENLEKFKHFGFNVQTVCQHGNPMTDFDNRDFFRNVDIQAKFPQMADIMVNFKELLRQDYVYISDVGMSFKIVNNPYNNSGFNKDPYTVLGNLDNVMDEINEQQGINYIISSHPHRYYKSFVVAWSKKAVFTIVRGIAYLLFKIPGLKKLLFRFNFISKKL